MKQKIIILFLGILIISCTSNKQNQPDLIKPLVETKVVHPEWSKDAVIYEVNIRQYTPEGTFKAFSNHLPRLKELGIEILWIMPIHPIGEKNRKGELGSYYSVRDYKAVNPEFGTLEDFILLVKKAHELEFKVIIDWVANHTAWDNEWMNSHPEWYKKDSLGNFYGPFDWTDVAQLDYENEELHDAMIDALRFWVKETNIDGYRCDVAGMVPNEFWVKAKKALDALKPVFMLAEDEQEHQLLEEAFNMNYGWEFHHIMNKIANNEADVNDLIFYFQKEDSIYSKSCYRMHFITNHDENSWNGTEFERMGDAVKTFAVMTFTIPGMPLVYTGQEVGFNKRLAFFTKDAVNYNKTNFSDFYRKLITLKKEHRVLWNGSEGGDMMIIESGDNNIFIFKRSNESEEILLVFNLSAGQKQLIVTNSMAGDYIEYFSKEEIDLKVKNKINLSGWDYKILVHKK
jgi:glycosidase